MWKLGNLYTPVSQTLDSWTPFSRISPISRKITHVTCSLLKTAPYTRKYHFSDTAQNTGHTKKRPGTGNNARRIGILFKSNFCRNYNM